ncbi:hypothetical protein [Parafrankia sp. EUN1f]|uniref:hypothetical protein n=1 Tax=Parafrankia sp. EUN1f TaxID=102897 RepID=UPI0002D2BDD9|nr:hypothetical protein [Parafrankia sp. EUN1f]
MSRDDAVNLIRLAYALDGIGANAGFTETADAIFVRLYKAQKNAEGIANVKIKPTEADSIALMYLTTAAAGGTKRIVEDSHAMPFLERLAVAFDGITRV